MELFFGFILFGTIALGIGGAVLFIKLMNWGAKKEREVMIERELRQEIIDEETRKKAAEKILRKAGQTP